MFRYLNTLTVDLSLIETGRNDDHAILLLEIEHLLTINTRIINNTFIKRASSNQKSPIW